MKYRYLDMIVEAIFTLAEPKGASEEDIWKFISKNKKFSESIAGGKKGFNISLSRVLKDDKYLMKTKSSVPTIKLTELYKKKLVKKVDELEDFDLARKHTMVTKDDNPKKSMVKNTKVKASKAGPKGKETLKKIEKAAETKKKNENSMTKVRKSSEKTKKSASSRAKGKAS